MDGRSRSPRWPDLHIDLLDNIAKRLDTCIDVLHFRGVCSTWRSSFPLPKFKSIPDCTLELPFPILHGPDIHPKRRGFFRLVESPLLVVQPLEKTSETTSSWLIRVQESEEVGQKLRLMNPLTCRPLANFHFDFPVGLNLLDHKVTEVSKAYVLEFVAAGENPPVDIRELKSVTCQKVAASSKIDDFSVMAIHTAGKLGIWKRSEEKWITIEDGRARTYYSDVCYHEGKFYAVANTGLTISVNSLMEVTEVASELPDRDDTYSHYKYLVKSGRDLLLVGHFEPDDDDFALWLGSDADKNGDEFKCGFVVYKLNEEEHNWVPMNSLDDRVLFVGNGCAFSISAQDFPGCKKNCIYYTENCIIEMRNQNENDYPGYDVAVFEMSSGSARPLSAFPGYSKLFWPPPAWLKPGSDSSRPTV